MHLIELAFKGNRKEFFLWDGESPPALKSAIVVEADRGEDIGLVHALGDNAQSRAKGCSHGPGLEAVTRVARRLASNDDVRRLAELREDDEQARRKAMERVKANGLQMKLTDAEWRWDRRKLTLYFTAEKRVDFRNLVRDLAAMFRTRIELKQIGVRDEAKRLSGIGRCGREYCSASWLPELRPVNLGVAKEQRLSLNPSQISGACGRLMCCLRYEHDFYVKQRRRFPKEGKTVTTTLGEEKVLVIDIFRERITLKSVEGEVRVVPLADYRREVGVSGTVEIPADEDTPVYPHEALSDEVIRLQDTSERPAWAPRPSSESSAPPARRLPVVEAEPASQAPASQAPASSRPTPSEARGRATEGPAHPATPPESELPDEEIDGSEDEELATPAESVTDSGVTESSERRSKRRRRGRRGGRRNRGADRQTPPGESGGANGGGGAPA